MKNVFLSALVLILAGWSLAFGREARLVRYPHYHNGRIVFSYLGDVWTADENGQNVQQLTVNRARDVYARFSPDGKWIAFSSDRNANLDVFIISSEQVTPNMYSVTVQFISSGLRVDIVPILYDDDPQWRV